EVAPDIPTELAAIVARAMEKNPADRFSSAAEMRDALSSMRPAERESPPILVVDDDAAVRDGLVRLLEDEGYRAVGATNGREALTRARLEMPRLILLDLKMPVMDGWQFLQEWNALKTDMRCPIVLLSGLSFIRDAAGVADFLSKPVDARRLLECVQRLGGPAREKTT